MASIHDRYTVHYPKQEGDKTHWPRIGTAFYEPGQRDRIVVKLDSMPMPQFWPDAKLVLYPDNKKEKEFND